MRKSISAGAGVTAAAVFTHGVVLSAMNFNQPLPVSSYQGFFRHMVSAAERLWSWAHGWQSMSHIRDFGVFFAPTVQVICPLIGFALFWILSGHKVGIKCWKPLAIALLLGIPSGYASPWIEGGRTILVVLLMVWSVGALPISRPHVSTTESAATA